MDYATVNDVITLFRPLTDSEKEKAEALIPIVCSDIRMAANKIGKNFDKLIMENKDMAIVAKSVVVDVIARSLMTPTQSQAGIMTQYAESAGGYAVSGSFLNPGGGLFIKKSEWERLGLRKQVLGAVEMNGGAGC